MKQQILLLLSLLLFSRRNDNVDDVESVNRDEVNKMASRGVVLLNFNPIFSESIQTPSNDDENESLFDSERLKTNNRYDNT